LPWRLGGRDRGGLDCWGLARLIWAERFGWQAPAYDTDYQQREQMAGLVATGVEADGWCEVDRPRVGDAVLCRLAHLPCHVGVFVGRTSMVHIMMGINAAIERLDGPLWSRRVMGYYRHAGA